MTRRFWPNERCSPGTVGAAWSLREAPVGCCPPPTGWDTPNRSPVTWQQALTGLSAYVTWAFPISASCQLNRRRSAFLFASARPIGPARHPAAQSQGAKWDEGPQRTEFRRACRLRGRCSCSSAGGDFGAGVLLGDDLGQPLPERSWHGPALHCSLSLERDVNLCVADVARCAGRSRRTRRCGRPERLAVPGPGVREPAAAA
jgi:hypothetical protein